jgi:ketosteroid isomerase-like protein
MPEHPNVENVRKKYHAFNNDDLTSVGELLADDVVWHVPGRSPIAGDYRGREETLAYLGQLAELTGGSYQAELHIAVGDDEHVITVDHSSATRAETHYGENEIVVFRFRDRRIVEVWQAPMSPYAHDDFFS